TTWWSCRSTASPGATGGPPRRSSGRSRRSDPRRPSNILPRARHGCRVPNSEIIAACATVATGRSSVPTKTPCTVRVVPTDEDLMIARHTRTVLEQFGAGNAASRRRLPEEIGAVVRRLPTRRHACRVVGTLASARATEYGQHHEFPRVCRVFGALRSGTAVANG